MFKSPKNYLQKKAIQLGLDRADQLSFIQKHLNAKYPNTTRAISLNNGVLKIITTSSSVASDLRLRQVELLVQFNALAENKITKLQIQIGSTSTRG